MSTILAQARLRACRHWPFASHAILSMVPVPRPGLGTLAVDKHWRLYHDDAALERMGVEQASGLILHELDHLLKRHHKRGTSLVGDDAAKWDTWNQATDASINSDLRLQGIPLPDGLIYPDEFDLPDGLSAEEYFRALDKQDDQQDGDQSDQGDDDDETQTSGTEDPETPADESGTEPSDEEKTDDDSEAKQTTGDSQSTEGSDSDPGSPTDDQGDSDPGHEGASDGPDESTGDSGDDNHPSPQGSETGGESEAGSDASDDGESEVSPQPVGSSGSCSDGRPRPWELGQPDDNNPGLDEADQEQLVHVTAKNVLEKGCGKGTGGHRRWAEEILNPPVDPAARLLNLVRRYCDVTVGIGERSYRRPSRRNSNPRMVLPSNVAPLPRITVIVDTSGSMDEEDLGLALGMIRKVLNSFRIRDGIRVVTGDAEGQTKALCLSDPRRIELTGGGGTDMAVIIAEALQERPKPQMILVCTDGWTPWPDDDPGIPIVACISRKLADLPEYYSPPFWIPIVELI